MYIFFSTQIYKILSFHEAQALHNSHIIPKFQVSVAELALLKQHM